MGRLLLILVAIAAIAALAWLGYRAGYLVGSS